MAFKVCCSCGDPYDVTCRRILYDGTPLNDDTTISGYDRQWVDAADLSGFAHAAAMPWVGFTKAVDYESNPSADVFYYATKHKPFRYKVGAVANGPDHRRDTGPPVRSLRHFNDATATNILFYSPIFSGYWLPVGGTGVVESITMAYRGTFSTHDYCRLVINGVAYAPVTTTGIMSTTGFYLLFAASQQSASLPSSAEWDFTDAEVYLDLWITTRIAVFDDDAYLGLTDDPDQYTYPDQLGIVSAGAPTYEYENRCTIIVGPSKFRNSRYEVTFDREGVGGESTVTLGPRNDPPVAAVSKWRPGAYDGSAVFAPSIAHWLDIDDPISPPDAGDGVYVTKTGAAAQSQGYTGSTPGSFAGVLTGAAIKVLAHCDNANGDCRFTGYYTRVNTNTNTVTGISESLSTSPTWHTLTRVTSIPNTIIPMIQTPRFGITIEGTDGTSKAYIDAIYLELQYDEQPEWEFTRTGTEGKQRLTHNPSGDYIEMQFGEELVKIIVNKGAAVLSGFHKDCLYMKNTEVEYATYDTVFTDGSGSWPYEIFADAWDGRTEVEFHLISRRATTAQNAFRFTPGGNASRPVIPAYASGYYDKDTGTAFIDFPRVVTIRKL